MRTVVQKYGGSSLATTEQIRDVAGRVARVHRSGHATVVVVSARGDATDELLALAAQVSDIRPPRELDQLIATAECASAALLALALHGLGVAAVSLTGGQAGVRATGKHGAGLVAAVHTERIRAMLWKGNVVVVAGFQGLNADGDIVTLGRGGSDTTAVALAAALGADRCEIYTDVDGVYTADPRVVPRARLQRSLDAKVMAELAFAGARVLHPRSVELADLTGVDLHVGSPRSGAPGTVVRAGGRLDTLETRGRVVAVTHDLDVARVLIQSRGARRDLAADVFGVLARHLVPVDLVARSGPHEAEFRMGFTIRRSDLAEIRVPLRRALAYLHCRVVVDENVGKISLVGTGLLSLPDHTARMMAALSAAGIATTWISTSQSRTSVTAPLDRTLDAVRALHDEFELDRRDAPCR